MKPLLLPIIISCLYSTYPCKAQSIDKAAIPGQYIFKSLLFDDPIDLNKDGRSSRHYEAEADACALDIRYELKADGSGMYTVGMQEKNCTNQQKRAIKWKIRTGKLKGSGVDGTARTYLVISDADGFDPTPFEIVKQNRKGITLRGEFRDGLDSTSPGNLELLKQ